MVEGVLVHEGDVTELPKASPLCGGVSRSVSGAGRDPDGGVETSAATSAFKDFDVAHTALCGRNRRTVNNFKI